MELESDVMLTYELGLGVKPLPWLSIGLNWDARVFFEDMGKEASQHVGIIGAKFGFEF